MADFIWLDSALYGDKQTCRVSTFGPKKDDNFVAAEFARRFDFERKPARVRLRVFADTRYYLYINGKYAGMGPVSAGGDFGTLVAMPVQYVTQYAPCVEGTVLDIRAVVRMTPVVMTDASTGHGGLWLEGEAEFEDGSVRELETDESWSARYLPSFVENALTDYTLCPDPWHAARKVPFDTPLELSPLAALSEDYIALPEGKITLKPHEKIVFSSNFDRIYGAYVCVKHDGGACRVNVRGYETVPPRGEGNGECIIFGEGSHDHRAMSMISAGGLLVEAENTSDKTAFLGIGIVSVMYPVEREAAFVTSDPLLNKTVDVCRHTLKICRQTLHLDSTSHQETLGCTGDYHIESLIEYFTFGDSVLSWLDIKRTADWLTRSDGFMFHTSYSCIWVEMLWRYYEFTGRKGDVRYCVPALGALIERFTSYEGENGIVETPPSWMFIDWTVMDGYSMHHPPKALGQTAVNAFWHRALKAAVRLYEALDMEKEAEDARAHADRLRTACLRELYDEKNKRFIDGLPTPQEPCSRPQAADMYPTKNFMTENPAKTYSTRHSNVLAVYGGLVEGEEAAQLLKRTAFDDSLMDYQPYFAHYVLDALEMCGLFAECARPIIERWYAPVKECSKGLAEGWIKPEPTYSFDHSHAWGGTPAYQMPCRLLGVKMLAPGFEKLELHPNLLWLDSAYVELPTPKGLLTCRMEKGKKPEITVPEGLNVIIR